MEVLKDLVRFNRYKSIESFNNATDITSSTISIVKLDENVMDIYIGRTRLTHSNFPEIIVELRNLINSLNNKLINLKNEFDSKNIDGIETKTISLSKDIKNIKDEIKNLHLEDVHIFEILSDIQNTLNISNGNNDVAIDIEKLKNNITEILKNNKLLKSDIINISNNLSNIKTTLSKKIDININDISIIKHNISELENALNYYDRLVTI